ncbi:NADH:ubiquinone oxidoreductase subunit H [Actinomyces radicidentis]|uniref:NADH-quinone oxidoreductase subunit H n=1 Tax=Actinomyces radicidentis TaxID=111015 RepID=A0A109W7A8_ACTRD|nr:NADH-quinone oxidoreductase subunit NuoH [Actinomyces radicidentis]AMD86583.1 NADH:ubiquinone oxidoreductase subunit H [Actinomyces radicidentis]
MSTATLLNADLGSALPTIGGATADFSQTTWWLSLIKAVFIMLFLILSVIMAIWAERRVLGRMQTRPGPNVNGFLGIPQLIADATKLIMKEDIWHKGAETFIFLLGPIITAFASFMIYAVIPFGPEVSMFGHVTPLQLTDFPVAVLYVLAITGFGVYGLILGGWSTHSTYPLLGAVRSAAQVISYELSMSMSILTVFLAAGTMSTSGIVTSQERIWWCLAMIPSFLIYVVSMVGEVNRLPFDLPEAEGELVAGHMTEYSSMKFAWYYLGEYINMFNVSAMCTTLFLGGWRSWILGSIWDGFNHGWWPMLWFIAKVWLCMFFMIWTRGTLVRIRYDHFMQLGWKLLIPVSLAWFVLVALVQGYRSFSGGSSRGLLLILGAVFLVAMLLLLLVPERGGDEKTSAATARTDADGDLVVPGEELDAIAGGFPVPPMPGEQLPLSPRARRAAAGAPRPALAGAQSTPDSVTNVQEGSDD